MTTVKIGKMTIHIYNKSRGIAPKGVVYVGRTWAGGDEHWGNPFTHHKTATLASVGVADRHTAVDAYRNWLLGTQYQEVEPKRRQWILDNIHKLRGLDLECWCAPQLCHASVLATMANTPTNEQEEVN